jgi:hypothetical protein
MMLRLVQQVGDSLCIPARSAPRVHFPNGHKAVQLIAREHHLFRESGRYYSDDHTSGRLSAN